MTKRTRAFLVPFALGVAALSLVVLSGCEKQPEGPENKRDSAGAEAVEHFMKNPVFQKAMKKESAIRSELAQTRNRLQAEADKMVAAAIAAGAKGEAEARASLAKNVEWVALNDKIGDLKTAIEDARTRMTRLVHDAMQGQAKKSGNAPQGEGK